MAISIQPVDGLINRLLQQNGKPTAAARQAAAPTARYDQINISSSAQGQQTSSAEPLVQQSGSQQSGQQSGQQHQGQQHQEQQKPGERALESHLLNLYKKNDNLGG